MELDLIVPEAIGSAEPWTSLPWYAHYDVSKHGDRTVLFQPSPASYVLVFPRTSPAPTPPPPDPPVAPEKP